VQIWVGGLQEEYTYLPCCQRFLGADCSDCSSTTRWRVPKGE
jgi:hypothetical protein